ncbi:MAG TPA: Crp/Fnr family transcriptional regulator [Acidisarcina sp.]
MPAGKVSGFNVEAFLSHSGLGRKQMEYKAKQSVFVQGEPAQGVYYLQKGRARLLVTSKRGKEATLAILGPGDFLGQEAIALQAPSYMSTAETITPCSILKIERTEALRVIHEEHSFSDLFIAYMVSRSMRVQADLVDQLFNSSEKRLARTLLLLAQFGQSGDPKVEIPKISQETLAEMVGTTRSRVSFFMNRFRKLGFIEYNGRIHVHKSLLNIILHD